MGHVLGGCGLGVWAAGCAMLKGAAVWQAGLLYAAVGAAAVLALAVLAALRGRGGGITRSREVSHAKPARGPQASARLATQPRKAPAGLRSGGRPVASQKSSHSASSAWTSRPGASARALSSAAGVRRGPSGTTLRA